MTHLIPIFPLSIVVYPGENLNLHIFEPRYKQLINDSVAHKKPFGIAAMLNNGVYEMGTLLDVVEVVKLYEDGKMDVRTKGIKIFRILEIVKALPQKLYDGAIVTYPPNDERPYINLMQQVLAEIRKLHLLLKISKDFKKPDDDLTSYDMAHHAGLSLVEEYELLLLMREDQRLHFLKKHLAKVIPLVTGLENLKEKIRLNGHFKELEGFNL